MRNVLSFELGRIGGLAIRIHFTWLLLSLWIIVGAADQTTTGRIVLAVCLLFSVAVHDLARVAVGRLFDIGTQAVTLYPFGGVSRLTKIPSPKAELMMAVAGPLTNGLIALLLLPVGDLPTSLKFHYFSLPWVEQLLLINAVLCIFNLLPALPLDGGRIVKCILVLIGSSKPTVLLSRITQALSLSLAITAFFVSEPVLFLGAFIIFFRCPPRVCANRGQDRGSGISCGRCDDTVRETGEFHAWNHRL